MAEKAGVIKDTEATNQERINELRAEIEQTRLDMHRTVSELQEKLSPANLRDEMQEKMREATVGRARRAVEGVRDAGSQIADLIRENPVPAILGSIGIGWLIIKAVQRDDGAESIPSQYYGRETYEEGTYAEEEPSSGEGGAGSRLYEKAADVGAKARGKASEYSEQARQKVGEARQQMTEKAQEISGKVRGSVSEYRERARGSAVEAKNWLSNSLQENPFGVALAVFAIGIAAGLALPVSEKERELGEQVASRTRETARSTIEKVKTVAEEARESTKRKAQEEGLM